MPVPRNVIIRADAAAHIGTGHVMRCLALAHAAKTGGMDVTLASRTGVPWLAQRLSGAEVAHLGIVGAVPTAETPEALLDQLAACGRRPGESWCVLDGYHFTSECHLAVRNAGYRLLVIDDYNHLPTYHADILFNQNPDASALPYRGDIGRTLFGPGYALLRPEFTVRRHEAEGRRHPPRAKSILLSLGGGDFSDHLARMASTLSIPEMAGATLRVIAGAMPIPRIRELLAATPASLEILSRVDDMAVQLLWADLAISAGGSTCWELCCLGLPFLTVEVAKNQRGIVRELAKTGIAPKLDENALRELVTQADIRQEAAKAGMALVDGRGSARVTSHLLQTACRLRQVRPDDSSAILAIANDPVVRGCSFSPQRIEEDKHSQWFAERLRCKDPFYVAEIPGEPGIAAYFRFDLENNEEANISVALCSRQRGKGLGARLIRESCSKAFLDEPMLKRIIAWVLPNNVASIRAFTAAGFSYQRTGSCRGHTAQCLVLKCDPNIPAEEPLKDEQILP